MKKIRILIFLCITNHSIAQSFSEKTSNGFTFAGEENSAAAFVDIDNDGDEDLLYSNIFYKNNDEEGFSSFFTFVGASNVIAFGDYNGDGFADVFIANTLYRNNAGTGFTAIRTF
ncbi:MAG: VCBS repeat-containing protein, partial [Chitinophagaceae bacterium]|nr:VCBS repeat-containing protein [Chitinophagaceae bacterium]